MRNLLFLFLRSLKAVNRIYLKARGMDENDKHTDRIISGKAWEEFCDELKAAGGALMYPGAPRDSFQQAEGIRYLTRLTRASLEAFIEFNDPAFPVLRRMVHETAKMGADNPDNHYYNAQISGKYEYRISGKRNTIHYLGFFTQNGNYGTTGGLAPCGKLEHTELKSDENGYFEIILSKTPKGKNWLKIEENTGLVIVRQTFMDRRNEISAKLFIENLDGNKFPGPVTPAMIDEGLKTASLFVGGAAMLFSKWAKGFKKHLNQLPMFDPEISNAAGGDPNITYYHSYWKLDPDEALLIEFKPPLCDSWNFQLNNYWMESLDYRYFPVTVNKASACYESDGSVRIIISSKDPERGNWMDTCNHMEGTMCLRWYRLPLGEKPVQPKCKLIKISEVTE